MGAVASFNSGPTAGLCVCFMCVLDQMQIRASLRARHEQQPQEQEPPSWQAGQQHWQEAFTLQAQARPQHGQLSVPAPAHGGTQEAGAAGHTGRTHAGAWLPKGCTTVLCQRSSQLGLASLGPCSSWLGPCMAHPYVPLHACVWHSGTSACGLTVAVICLALEYASWHRALRPHTL